jgi:hypothetical protein
MGSRLSIIIGVGDDDSDTLAVNISGSPNQVLGFIARARHELDKNEKIILANIDKPKAPK